ncbi:MAG: response regulator [Acidobacteriota bacterium]|nr:response regulator [Acidobacteriota bacterium]
MPTVVSRIILVVADEPAVRATVRRQLETLGHKVVVADTAATALDLLRGEPPPEVLVTDVVLGAGMNGIDLADAARMARPDLPVILMSGFTAVPEAQARIRALGAPLLSKPSTLSQLERALQKVCPDH